MVNLQKKEFQQAEKWLAFHYYYYMKEKRHKQKHEVRTFSKFMKNHMYLAKKKRKFPKENNKKVDWVQVSRGFVKSG